MIKKVEDSIAYSFYLLFFLTPLVMYPKTSELFEFNKMVTVYLFTIIIVFLWITKMVLSEKLIFRKTKLDTFLLIFFLSQLISTLISIDIRSSFFGYYSRFHGGLLSTISYILLYWAYVSNMDIEKTKKTIFFTFTSAILVSLWAIFEHFGKSFSCLIFPGFGKFDVSCWVQDVASRVFATFGQPNWLAAWLAALIPLTWAYILIWANTEPKPQNIKYKQILWIFIGGVLFITLLYTKSRSGILGFGLSTIVFWFVTILLTFKKALKREPLFKNIVATGSILLFLIIIIGTPWTPKLADLSGSQSPEASELLTIKGPALEVGGTESGQIRKIVWKGAFELWKNYPLFGTGVETFAFSYYKHRPVEHNLVSEWNFLYNKAHNEYLNYAATTGTVGLLSYLSLILFSLVQIFNFKSKKPKQDTTPKIKTSLGQSENPENVYIKPALAAGYISILITNFFGFTVVGVALFFFLFPAMAYTLGIQPINNNYADKPLGKLTSMQYILITVVTFLLFITLNSLKKYWYADYLYAQGKLENDSGLYSNSRSTLIKALKYSPNESVFWDELSDTTSFLAILYAENNDIETAKKAAMTALSESDKAISLSPKSVILKKTRVRMLANLSLIDPSYMQIAKKTLLEASQLAPTDAHISYNLAITYFKTGDTDAFLNTLKKTIEMKPNYKQARFALAQNYIHENQKELAKNELEYILKNIDRDPEVEKELAKLDDTQ